MSQLPARAGMMRVRIDGREVEVPHPWEYQPKAVEDAVSCAIILLQDTYRQLFQVTPTTAASWAGALRGVEPRALIEAVRAWVRSGADMPPSPGQIRTKCRPNGAEFGARPTTQSDIELATAIRCRDEIAGLKECGRWKFIDTTKREYLEAWAAKCPAGIPIKTSRTPNDVDAIVNGLARRFDVNELERHPIRRLQA